MVNLHYTLSLFGTDRARDNFLQLCKQYYGERIRHEASEISGEPVLNSRRATIHNQIVKIVEKQPNNGFCICAYMVRSYV